MEADIDKIDDNTWIIQWVANIGSGQVVIKRNKKGDYIFDSENISLKRLFEIINNINELDGI